jgi:hypothetical protein
MRKLSLLSVATATLVGALFGAQSGPAREVVASGTAGPLAP